MRSDGARGTLRLSRSTAAHPDAVRWRAWPAGDAATSAAESRWISAAGVAPVQQRRDWPAFHGRGRWYLLELDAPDAGALGAVGVWEMPLRSLPGFFVLRVHKFGHGLSPRLWRPMLEAVRDFARSRLRVVRVHVEAFNGEPGGIDHLADLAAELGFSRLPTVREYERTLFVDLSGSDDDVAHRFHRMVMKNVRKSERAGHVVRPIHDERYAVRMVALVAETFARTGGRSAPVDWRQVLRVARAAPHAHRVAGLFIDGGDAPESLSAFRWCGCSGDMADDLFAASTRLDGPAGSVPMMPAIMLHMFRWAREQGASRFDFGGVVERSDPRYAKLGSITEFKQLFGGTTERVGADFTLTIRPRLSELAGALSSLARGVSGR